jgi:hypothetical protein
VERLAASADGKAVDARPEERDAVAVAGVEEDRRRG